MGKFLWQSFYEDLNLNFFKAEKELLEAETSLDAAVMCAAFVGIGNVFRIRGLGY